MATEDRAGDVAAYDAYCDAASGAPEAGCSCGWQGEADRAEDHDCPLEPADVAPDRGLTSIEICPRCEKPTHPSDSNDDGVCTACLGRDAITPAHDALQRIPALHDFTNLTDAEREQRALIFIALDEVLAARNLFEARMKPLTASCAYPGRMTASMSMLASTLPQAESALRLWAEARGFELRDEVSTYPDDRQIRSLSCYGGGDPDRIAWVQWDSEPITKKPGA